VRAASAYPYPYGGRFFYQYAREHPRWDVPVLTADEYFDLYAALPGWSDIAANPRAAFRPLGQWRARHPQLARAFPAKRMLDEARTTLQVCEGTVSPDKARALGIPCPGSDW
jgi:hypothetical protein